MDHFWIWCIVGGICIAAIALAKPTRFFTGLIVGIVLAIGLDVVYLKWVWPSLAEHGREGLFGWIALFWPDWMARTVLIEDWKVTPDTPPVFIAGYSAVGLYYGTIIGVVHALKKSKKKSSNAPDGEHPQASPSEAKVVIPCPSCGQRLQVPLLDQAVRYRCVHCDREFTCPSMGAPST
jgi:hypothetical protein